MIYSTDPRIGLTQHCAFPVPQHTDSRLAEVSSGAGILTWVNVALLGPPSETQQSRRQENKQENRWSQVNFFLFFFRSKWSKFSVTLGPRLIKTSSCRVGTHNKQARSPCSVPTHNLIKDMRIMQRSEPAIEARDFCIFPKDSIISPWHLIWEAKAKTNRHSPD